MYNISDEAKSILNNRFRDGKFKSRVTMHDGTVFNNEIIESITWSDGIIMDDHFEIGTATMAQITATIMNKDNALDYSFEGKEAYIEIGIVLSSGSIEYIPLGYFTVEKAPRTNDYDITLTCSDRMHKAETPYVCSLTFPATLLQVAQDICNEADIELENTSFVNSDYILETKPSLKSDLTCRKAIMAVAELAGGYAHINRSGKLEITNANADINDMVKYVNNNYNASTDGYLIADELINGVDSISRDNYSTLVNKELPLNKIDAIVIGTTSKGTGDNPLAISSDNIFLQDASKVIDSLYNALNDFSYQPITMTWQGNPAIDCGDKLTILGRNGSRFNTIATSRTMSFNGGLSEDYTAVGKSSTEENSTPVSDIDIKIADTKDDLQKYADNAVSVLAGNKGGYVYFRRNADDTPSEIFVMDTPDPTTAKKCIRINQNGIGGSTNGINGPFNVSILITGEINASMVTTGTMIADRIQGGTLSLGGLNNANGSLVIVDGSGVEIGRWDENGITITKGTLNGATITSQEGSSKIIINGGTVSTYASATGFKALEIINRTIAGYDFLNSGQQVWQIESERDIDSQGNPTGAPSCSISVADGCKLDIGKMSSEGSIPILTFYNNVNGKTSISIDVDVNMDIDADFNVYGTGGQRTLSGNIDLGNGHSLSVTNGFVTGYN